jgi:hypothetical protein
MTNLIQVVLEKPNGMLVIVAIDKESAILDNVISVDSYDYDMDEEFIITGKIVYFKK